MSVLSLSRINTLREALEAENIDLTELAEIQEAYHHWANQSTTLSEDPDNAMADDMLNELETAVSPLERALWGFIKENYGESEANDPCFELGEIANFIESKFEVKEK